LVKSRAKKRHYLRKPARCNDGRQTNTSSQFSSKADKMLFELMVSDIHFRTINITVSLERIFAITPLELV